MTPTQKRVLDLTSNYIKERGYSPTDAKIAKLAGVSQQSINRTMQCLIERGYISKMRHFPRSVKILAA